MSTLATERKQILQKVYDVPRFKDPCKRDVALPGFMAYQFGGLIDAWKINRKEKGRLLLDHNNAAMDLTNEAIRWQRLNHFKLAMLFNEAAAAHFAKAGKYGYPKWEREVRACLEAAMARFGEEEALRHGLVTPDFLRAKARAMAQMRPPIYQDNRDFTASAALEEKEAERLEDRIVSDPEYRAWVRLCLLHRSVIETDNTFEGMVLGSVGGIRFAQIGEMQELLPTAIMVVPKEHAEEIVEGFRRVLRAHDRADFGTADLFCEARVRDVCKAALDARAARS
jgi:hypothetical protein